LPDDGESKREKKKEEGGGLNTYGVLLGVRGEGEKREALSGDGRILATVLNLGDSYALTSKRGRGKTGKDCDAFLTLLHRTKGKREGGEKKPTKTLDVFIYNYRCTRETRGRKKKGEKKKKRPPPPPPPPPKREKEGGGRNMNLVGGTCSFFNSSASDLSIREKKRKRKKRPQLPLYPLLVGWREGDERERYIQGRRLRISYTASIPKRSNRTGEKERGRIKQGFFMRCAEKRKREKADFPPKKKYVVTSSLNWREGLHVGKRKEESKGRDQIYLSRNQEKGRRCEPWHREGVALWV